MNGGGLEVPGIKADPLSHAGIYGVGSLGTMGPLIPSRVLSFIVSICIQYVGEDGLGS